jgi:hypothetical protein
MLGASACACPRYANLLLSVALLPQEVRYPHHRTKKNTQATSGYFSWCTITDVKITFPDDIDDEIEAIRELLADDDKKEISK